MSRCTDHCPAPGRGSWWLFVVVSTVVFSTVATLVVRGATAADGAADAVFQWLLIAAGLAVATAGAGAIAWGVTDTVRSRTAVARFQVHNATLGARALTARKAPTALPEAPVYRADAVRVAETERELS
jgi:hypothetical protein